MKELTLNSKKSANKGIKMSLALLKCFSSEHFVGVFPKTYVDLNGLLNYTTHALLPNTCHVIAIYRY